MAAVSTDSSKQILQGIHMAAGFMEATDGHRLMRVPVALPDGIDLVLPASTMKLLQDRTVTVAAAAGQAVIDAGDGITIYSRILDGKYPDVAALVPKSFEHAMTLDRHRFTRCLERVALIAEAHNSVVKLEARNNDLIITAEADANNGRELLHHDGTAKGHWAFNVHYLLDGLKAMRGHEAVLLSANSATTPVTLQPADKTGMTYLVMPVQIRE
jgi:DNA polymerase-3 subunit beta